MAAEKMIGGRSQLLPNEDALAETIEFQRGEHVVQRG